MFSAVMTEKFSYHLLRSMILARILGLRQVILIIIVLYVPVVCHCKEMSHQKHSISQMEFVVSVHRYFCFAGVILNDDDWIYVATDADSDHNGFGKVNVKTGEVIQLEKFPSSSPNKSHFIKC